MALIEIFTDSSSFGEDFIEQVKASACPKCSITIYDSSSGDNIGTMQLKAGEYGISSLPAVVMEGRLVTPEKLAKLLAKQSG